MRTMWMMGVAMVCGGLVACEVEGELDDAYVEDVDGLERFGGIGIGIPGDGAPCTVTEQGNFEIGGDFEVTGSVTSGCEDGEICLTYACNNAIPQTCYGTCGDGGGSPFGGF